MKIGYARVSTLDQSPDLQIEKLKEAGCEKVVVEKASGARIDRPELNRLLRDILRPGDVLVIWKLDRLARSLRQLIDTAADLKERDIGLKSLTDAIDTTSPGGMLVFHMLGAISEFERSLIIERTRAGLLSARAQGRIGGRPKKMTEKDIAAAKAMIASGMSAAEVAKKFGIGRSTLFTYLK